MKVNRHSHNLQSPGAPVKDFSGLANRAKLREDSPVEESASHDIQREAQKIPAGAIYYSHCGAEATHSSSPSTDAEAPSQAEASSLRGGVGENGHKLMGRYGDSPRTGPAWHGESFTLAGIASAAWMWP
jgi:hypothetical protein